MFGTHLLDRRSTRERVADQAWEYLLSAAGSAKDTARAAGHRASDLTSDTGSSVSSAVGGVADEAYRRASAAFDALAGRRAPTPWTLILIAGAVGAVVGWVAGSASRSALRKFSDSDDDRTVEKIEFVDADRPVTLDT
jgi:ElaB/YqjD/DUF883 family membrane-anchored ribosome-binding protein